MLSCLAFAFKATPCCLFALQVPPTYIMSYSLRFGGFNARECAT